MVFIIAAQPWASRIGILQNITICVWTKVKVCSFCSELNTTVNSTFSGMWLFMLPFDILQNCLNLAFFELLTRLLS